MKVQLLGQPSLGPPGNSGDCTRLDFYSCPVHTCASPSRVTGSWSRRDLDVYVMASIWQFLGVKGVSTQRYRVNSHQTVCPDTRIAVLASVQAPGFPSHSRARELGSSHGCKSGALILLSFYR